MSNKLTINQKKRVLFNAIEIAVVVVIFGISLYIYKIDKNWAAGILCMFSAIAFYSYFTYKSKNLLNFQAVFSLAWLGTIGMAMLRLLNYQIKWSNKSLLAFYLTYIIFMIGLLTGGYIYQKLQNHKIFNFLNKEHKFIEYHFQSQRIFAVAMVSAIIGILCFIITVKIKGFIPIFSTSITAYRDFYTKFVVFEVATIASCGLAYYGIKKVKLTLIKKILLFLSILFLMSIPVLSVSRGVIICVCVMFAVPAYFFSKRRAFALICVIIIGLGSFVLTTQKRNLSDETLDSIYDPKEVVIETKPEAEAETENLPKTIQLSPKMAFVYGYFTIGLDNIAYNIDHFNSFSKGLYQLAPFNVILRNTYIENKLNDLYIKIKQVPGGLNTYSLIGPAYFDFGMYGIIVMTLIWSVAFGIIEAFFLKHKGACSALVYGITLIPIALCFFDGWMSIFTTWMWWGTSAIYFIILNFKRKSRSNS